MGGAGTARRRRPAGTSLPVYAEQRRIFDRLMVEGVSTATAPPSLPRRSSPPRPARKPRLRYAAGPLAGRARILDRLAPAGIFDSQIRKMNNLAG